MEEEWKFVPDYEEDQTSPSKDQTSKRPRKRNRRRGPLGQTGPLCQLEVFVRLRKHIDEVHLPWYLEPHRCCWTCEQSFPGIGLVLSYHNPEQPGHSASSLLTDDNLQRWARLMLGVITHIAIALSCPSIRDLLQLVIDRRWYPTESRFYLPPVNHSCFRMLDHFWGVSAVEEYTLNPPNQVSMLCHWNIMMLLMSHLPEDVQQTIPNFRGERRCRGELHHSTVDSHCHIANIIREGPRMHILDDMRRHLRETWTVPVLYALHPFQAPGTS